jgi:hypothetical protein
MARAVAALRIAGAAALGWRVAQLHVLNGETERVGQLEVRSGILRRKRVLLSAATTPASLLAAIEGRNVSRATVQPIMDALQQFSVAVYGREGEADPIALNNAVDEALVAIRSLWTRSLNPFSAARRADVTMPRARAGSAV